MSTIAIQSNTKNLMNALSVTFSDKFKVLTEMIQNARRAQASEVHIHTELNDEQTAVEAITICDNGIGISDMQALFTIGGSGWDDVTSETENPYGIGSIAMLFACEALTITSLDKQITLLSQDVLDEKPIEVKTLNERYEGTRITMYKTKFQHSQTSLYNNLDEKLKKIACYSTIKVNLNGKWLEQTCTPQALIEKGYGVLKTEIGDLYFDGSISKDCNVILQDLPVYSRLGNSGYFFADSSFKAQMPDRDALVDKDSERKRIQAAIAKAAKPYLSEEKQRLMGDAQAIEDWVRAQFSALCSYAIELFNDIDYLPPAAFTSVADANLRCGYSQEADAVRKGKVRPFTFTQFHCDSAMVQQVFHEQNTQFLKIGTLDSAHWIFDEYEAFNTEKVKIHVEGGRKVDDIQECDGVPMVIGVAKEIVIEYKEHRLEVNYGGCIYSESELYDLEECDEDELSVFEEHALATMKCFGNMIFLDTNNIEEVLLQFREYLTEGEDHDDHRLYSEVKEFENVLSAEFGITAEVYVQRLLKSLPTPIVEQIKQGSLLISANEAGDIVTECA